MYKYTNIQIHVQYIRTSFTKLYVCNCVHVHVCTLPVIYIQLYTCTHVHVVTCTHCSSLTDFSAVGSTA